MAYVRPAQSSPQPIAWWSFNEGQGAVVADASGNGHDGTLYGSATWTNGLVGSALNFDGNSYVAIPFDQSLLLGQALTIEASIRPTSYRSDGYEEIAQLWYSYLLRFDLPAEGGQLSFFTVLDGNAEPRLSAGIPSLGDWHQVFAVWTGTNMQLWVDGVERANARTGNPSPKTNQLDLGPGFIGTIDEVKIYNCALTESEILNEMLPRPAAALQVAHPVLGIGQPFTVSCVVSNISAQPLTNGVVTLNLPAGLALVGGANPMNIPPVTKSAPALLQWTLTAGSALTTNLSASVQFAGFSNIELTVPVVAARPIPSPPNFYAAPTLIQLSNDLVLANSSVRLVFPSNDFGYGVFAVDANQSNVWTRMAVANCFSRLAVKPGTQVLRRLVQAQNYQPLTPGPGSAGVEFTNTIDDGSGTLWSCSFSFVVTNDDRIDIRYKAVPDQAGWLTLFQGPTVYVGEGSFGSSKDDALFCGLEWLVGDESSSSNLDMHEPTYYIRFVPHPNKVTIPLMAVSKNATALALFWNCQQMWDATNTQPAAVFASPNFLDGQQNHLMGLFLPSVPQWTGENQREAAQNPYPFRANIPLQLEAWLACVTPATQSVACLSSWFDTFGVPEPAPLPHTNYISEVDFSMQAFLQSLWNPVDQKWWSSKGGAVPLTYLSRSPSYAFELQMAAILTTNTQYQTQYLARATLTEGLDGTQPSWDDLGFTWADPATGLAGVCAQATSDLDSMWADGSWRFSAYIATNGADVGMDYGLLGTNGAAEIGTCAHSAYEVLHYARLTGDAGTFSTMKKSLAFMDQFTMPRAAQVWECPVHSPDVLAASDAVDAYLEAFRCSGDQHYLNQARFWAWRGLPFIYMWNPPAQPMLRYASIPIYGGSWYQGSWIGQPVQWNGLRYAYGLLKLADYDNSFPWKKIAEGITRSAMCQQDQTGTNMALWPDNFSALNWTKNPWVFEPGAIMKNVFKMQGHDIEPNTTIVVTNGQQIFITSRATISQAAWTGSQLAFTAIFQTGESGCVIVANLWEPSKVLLNGSSLPAVQGDLSATPTNAWKYDAQSRFVVMRFDTAGPQNLEILGTRLKPGTLIPPVTNTVEFDFDSDFGGWLPINQITGWHLENGGLKGTAAGGNPYMTRLQMQLDGSRCSKIAVRARASAGASIALYWITTDSPVWGEDKAIHFPLQSGGGFNQYLFEVDQYPGWAGKTIIGLRLDPLEGGTGGDFEVDYIRGNTPRLTPLGFLGNTFSLNLDGIPQIDYQVDFSTNLVDWLPLIHVVPQAVSTQLGDTNGQHWPARFYRARTAW